MYKRQPPFLPSLAFSPFRSRHPQLRLGALGERPVPKHFRPKFAPFWVPNAAYCSVREDKPGRTNFVLHHWASRPSPLATRPSGHKKGVFKALILLPNVLNVWMKSDITVVDQDGGNPPRSSSATLEINVEDPDSRIPTFINAPISFFVRENEPSVSYYCYWYKKVSVHRWQSRSGSRQSADGDEQQPLMSAAACQPDTPVTSNIDYKNSSDINYDINRGSLAHCHFIAEIATKLAIRKFV